MLKVIDLKNNPYPAQAQVKRKQIVNGEQQLSLSFFVSEMNIDFLPNLSFNWLANFDKEDYTIINPSIEAITKGKSITAILKFFTDFGSMYLQDEVGDKSMTALNAYTELFSNTGKRVHLVDNFYSNTLSYQKNQSRLERFHYYNTRFKAEFIVRGDDVYLYNKIGSYKADVRIDEDLNIKSATVEIDSENFFTWCKCYYDLEQNDEGGSEENYRKEYVWSDSALIAQYGEIEGPALYQGNIKNETTMKEFARDKQQESVKISHSVDLVDLQKQGYAEFVFNIGDTVRLSLSSIDITVDIRIVEKDETWVENQYGEWERTALSLTLGNASAVQSYKNSRSDSMQELQDWIDGRKPIPPNLLEPGFQRAADIINGDTDSVMEYRKDRLAGHHSKNEGNRVQMNVTGLQYVRNGVPGNALTFEGLFVDNATTGMLNTHNVLIQGTKGHFTMDGDMLKATNYNNADQYTEITPQRTYHKQGHVLIETKTGRRSIIDGMLNRSSTMTAREPGFISSEVTADGSWFRTTSTQYVTVHLEHFVHEARWLFVAVGLNDWGYDDIVDARMETPDGKISNYFSTETLGGGTHYGWLRIDLGEPLDRPTTGSVQIKMKSRRGNQVRMHIANRFLTDFPDNL